MFHKSSSAFWKENSIFTEKMRYNLTEKVATFSEISLVFFKPLLNMCWTLSASHFLRPLSVSSCEERDNLFDIFPQRKRDPTPVVLHLKHRLLGLLNFRPKVQQSNAAHVYYLHATFETTDACPMLLRGKLKQFNESQIRLTDPVYGVGTESSLSLRVSYRRRGKEM